MKIPAIIAAGTFAAFAFGSTADAVANDIIVIPASNVVYKTDSQTVVVGTADTPDEFIGVQCQASVVGQNGESVHPGNDLLISTNGSVVRTIEGFEDTPFQNTSRVFPMTLGPTVTATLRFGETEVVSSGGLTVTVDCPEQPAPTTTVPKVDYCLQHITGGPSLPPGEYELKEPVRGPGVPDGATGTTEWTVFYCGPITTTSTVPPTTIAVPDTTPPTTTPSTPTTTPTTPQQLPATGTREAALVAFGIVLLAVGTALVIASHRRN